MPEDLEDAPPSAPEIVPSSVSVGPVERPYPRWLFPVFLSLTGGLLLVQGGVEVWNTLSGATHVGPLGWLWKGTSERPSIPGGGVPSGNPNALRLQWREPGEVTTPPSGMLDLTSLKPGIVKLPSTEGLAEGGVALGGEDYVVPDLPLEEREAMEKKIKVVIEDFGAAATPAERSAFVMEPAAYTVALKQLAGAGKAEYLPRTFQGCAVLEKFGRRLVLSQFIDEDGISRQLVLFRRPNSVDWGIDVNSLYGLSEIPWSEARRLRPESRFLIRAKVAFGEYYNYEFSDRSSFVCVEMEDPVTGELLYGYCPRDGEIHRKASQWIDPRWGKVVDAATLQVAYPPSAASDQCVIIRDWVTSGWVLP